MALMRLTSRWLYTPNFCSSTSYQIAYCSPAVLSTLHCRLLSSSSSRSKTTQSTDIQLKESDLDESFVKGSGKGGQKINKVRNCVLLTHLPTGLQVRTQKTRSLDGNRRVARKLLLQKLDDHVNGPLSKRSEKIERLRRKKANRRAKSKQKYAKAETEEDEEDTEVEANDDEIELVDLEEHQVEPKKKAT